MKITSVLLILIISLMILKTAFAQTGVQQGGYTPKNVHAKIASDAIPVQITEESFKQTKKSNNQNLSEMIRNSRPFGGLNPSPKINERLMPVPCRLNDVTSYWQGGTYQEGWYTGYIEGPESIHGPDSVYVVVSDDTPAYTEYLVTRLRCYNPLKYAVYFRVFKKNNISVQVSVSAPQAPEYPTFTAVNVTAPTLNLASAPAPVYLSENRASSGGIHTPGSERETQAFVPVSKQEQSQYQKQKQSQDSGGKQPCTDKNPPTDPGAKGGGTSVPIVTGTVLSTQPVDLGGSPFPYGQ